MIKSALTNDVRACLLTNVNQSGANASDLDSSSSAYESQVKIKT